MGLTVPEIVVSIIFDLLAQISSATRSSRYWFPSFAHVEQLDLGILAEQSGQPRRHREGGIGARPMVGRACSATRARLAFTVASVGP